MWDEEVRLMLRHPQEHRAEIQVEGDTESCMHISSVSGENGKAIVRKCRVETTARRSMG